MSSMDDALQQFHLLGATEKLLVSHFAEGKSVEEIARLMRLRPMDVRIMTRDISKTLCLPQLGSIYAVEQQLAEIGRLYRLQEEEKMLGAPAASLRNSLVSRAETTGELDAANPELVATAPQEESEETLPEDVPEEEQAETYAQAPRPVHADLDQLAERMDRLKERWQTTISMVCQHGQRTNDVIATKLGIGPQGLYQRVQSIYVALGIAALENDEKKLLLKQGWSRLMAKRQKAMTPREAIQAVEVLPPSALTPVEVPVPVVEMPRVVKQVERESQVAQPSQTPPAPSYGSGVVIPLPPNLTNLDVVSGLFNGGEPTDEMAKAVRQRKEKGLKPAYLVLSPSSVDPAMSLAQVVFFDREPK